MLTFFRQAVQHITVQEMTPKYKIYVVTKQKEAIADLYQDEEFKNTPTPNPPKINSIRQKSRSPSARKLILENLKKWRAFGVRFLDTYCASAHTLFKDSRSPLGRGVRLEPNYITPDTKFKKKTLAVKS